MTIRVCPTCRRPTDLRGKCSGAGAVQPWHCLSCGGRWMDRDLLTTISPTTEPA